MKTEGRCFLEDLDHGGGEHTWDKKSKSDLKKKEVKMKIAKGTLARSRM